MANLYVVGAGAGLVSALLFAATSTFSPLAIFLSYIAPLPIVIASLGWMHLTGLLGVALGGAALSLTLGSKVALAYAIGIGLPAWAVSYLLLRPLRTPDGPSFWLPLGFILAATAVISALVTVAGVIAIGGSYENYQTVMRTAIEGMIRLQMQVPEGQPLVFGDVSPDEVVTTVAGAVPFITGATLVPILIMNLWAGARAVTVSGRMPRPWVPTFSTQMPKFALALLGGGILVATLSNFLGVFGQAVTGAMIMALALQGLAAIHDRSLGNASRPFVLSTLYLFLVLLLVWVLPLLAVYGLIDLIVGRRKTPPPAPPAQIA